MAFSKIFFYKMNMKFSSIFILILCFSIKGDGRCPGNLVPCLNQTDCIPIEQVCMKNHRCVDSEGHDICGYCDDYAGDTIACLTKITPDLLYECLSPNQICDGRKDCVNNDDEAKCGIERCSEDSWACSNGLCINKTLLCNRHADCTDGSDEGDMCHHHIYDLNKFHCRTGQYIPKSEVCDGIPQCPHDDDEENCLHPTSITINDSCSIPSNTFMCSSWGHSICISNDRLCDGYRDCPKGDDEINCNEKCLEESKCSSNINIKCIQHSAVNQLCRCEKEGYQLIKFLNTQICQDFNECNDSFGVYCSFECFNIDGTYNCTCPIGYSIDQETKTCRKHTDRSKADFLILYDDNISLYNIWNTTNQYSLKLFKKTILNENHHFNHIEYDFLQMFLIYYDRNQRTIFCKSSLTYQTLILISNITIDTFSYNIYERTIFLLEKSSRTLRMYTPITCEISQIIQMHSWTFTNHLNIIHTMIIDFEHRQFLFATNNEFLISNMSEPNSTNIIYSSNREIKRIFYDNTFKRILWTTVDKTHQDIFLVHTCQDEFKKCFDTKIILPTSGPLIFFNDGLIYMGLSNKSIDFIQIYGKHRFEDHVLMSTNEQIHSFLFFNNQSIQFNNLCKENSSITRCKNQICLQINSREINCLSIDANFISTSLFTSNSINNLNNPNPTEVLITNGINPSVAKQQRISFYKRSTKIVWYIISLAILLGIIAFIIKRYQQYLTKRRMHNEQHQIERYSTVDGPNLDEFNVMVDDRSQDRLPLTNQLHY